MKKIFYLMAMAIATMVFTSCSDDDNYITDVTLPAEATGNAMVVDAWANDFTLDIKSEGAWKIESDSYFFSVEPEEGAGDATITVRVQNNTRSKRKKGHLTIVFPEHEGDNKTFTIEQKWKGEYDENADVLGKSNIIYAVGFGYDATRGISPNSDFLRAEIFNTSYLINKGVESTGEFKMTSHVSTVTGNSISELSNKLTVKAGASGSYGGFKAEANATFNMDYQDNSSHEYAINYLEAFLTKASLTKALGRLKKRQYMTEEAYEDINGLFEDYATNNPEGFKNLIRDYGTHVVISAKLGGRVRQTLDVDVSKIKESYDLNVFAKASYEGVVNASVSAEDDFHKSFEKYRSSIEINVDAVGGDKQKGMALVAKDGLNATNFDTWFKSINEDNMALMGFEENSLVPLYDLVDQSATVDKDGFDGKARYNALYKYMTEELAKGDNSTYDTGTVTEFNVPNFKDNHGYNQTLVKDIMLGGQLVGQVCEEYIPIIDRTKRVTVVYPVIGTKVCYHMGFFIGDTTHKPARVAWNGTKTNINEYPELNFGQVTKLYLRGATITTTPAEGVEVRMATLEDEYMDGLRKNAPHDGNIPSKYPLVKIFDKIWTRENYRREIWDGEYSNWGHYVNNGVEGQSDSYWEEYYNLHSVQNPDLFPAGWRVASGADFQEMKDKLSANGWGMPALALRMGAVTGFDIVWSGWVDKGSGGYNNSPDQMEYVTSDECHIRLRKDGTFDICPREYNANDWLMGVRLIKK